MKWRIAGDTTESLRMMAPTVRGSPASATGTMPILNSPRIWLLNWLIWSVAACSRLGHFQAPLEWHLALRWRDWRGLIHYGGIFFGLEQLGAVLGVFKLHMKKP